MKIPNATNFDVKVEISKNSLFEGLNFSPFNRRRRPKAYSLICAMHENKNTKYRAWKFGERQDGDTILYAHTEIGKWIRYIEYKDYNVNFTAALIKLNVRKIDIITYV